MNEMTLSERIGNNIQPAENQAENKCYRRSNDGRAPHSSKGSFIARNSSCTDESIFFMTSRTLRPTTLAFLLVFNIHGSNLVVGCFLILFLSAVVVTETESRHHDRPNPHHDRVSTLCKKRILSG